MSTTDSPSKVVRHPPGDSPSAEHTEPEQPTAPPTEGNLANALVLPGPDFASLLKSRAQQRKDREDAAVAALRVQVSRLEAALQAETKRRIAVTQQLQTTAAGEWERVERTLQQQYQDLAQQADQRWMVLEDRLSALEEKWKTDVLAAEQATTETTQAMEARLADVQRQAEVDQANRQALVERLEEQMKDLARQWDEKWQAEAAARTTAVADLRSSWEATHQDDDQRDVTLRLEQEVEQVRNALVQERMERQQQDEGLVQSLQAYSQSLQESLAGIL